MSSDKKFLLSLLTISILLRLLLDLLYIYPPDIPHDFYAYIGAGKAFLSGTLYQDLSTSATGSRYGFFFAMVMGVTLKLFGESFFFLKLPSTIADLGTIVVIYYIIKNLIGTSQAKYGSIFYAFSYLTLSNAMEGQDDHFFMLFMLISIYYVLKGSIITSALFTFISTGFKPTALIIVPPIMYYVYRVYGAKASIKYTSIVTILLLAVLLSYGQNAIYVYSPAGTIYQEYSGAVGANYYTLYHYIDYYFNYGIDSPYNDYVLPVKALKPFSIAGFILIIIYFYVHKLTDSKIELFRNIFMLMFVGVMLAAQGDVHYIFWYLPFITVIFVNSQKINLSEFKLGIEQISIALIIISILIHATIYRWDFVPYNTIERLIILFGSIIAGVGTLLMLNKLPQKYCLSIITFWYAVELQLHSYILKVFSCVFPILEIRHYAWGILSFMTNVAMVIALTWLFILVHNSTKNKVT